MTQGEARDASPKSGPANVNLLSNLRNLGRFKRAEMAKGAMVELISHDGQEVVTELSLGLFNVLSEKPDLVRTVHRVHRISLQINALPVAVKELVARLTTLTDPDVNVYAMQSTGNFYKDIHIASVADQLGLSVYTQRMLNAHWQRLKTCIPTPSDVDTISKIDTPLGNKLFDMITLELAKLAYHNELPNPAAFEGYRTTNPRFSTAVTEHIEALQYKAEAFAAREARRQLREEQARAEDERARKAALKQSEERKKEKVKFQAREKEEKEMGDRVREKMRAKGSKYTAAEARYVWKVMGKRVPVGAGK
ncbi:hypothetical protein FB567DRAFT_447357 [Paraphoma chrysanthemicola]|uniref:Uncharacterized protein n=1 Tax=Paraphoma chrysanthemicola TaxID=798071 RepID=A0A8K0R3Q6_9PLEO|nr:hypothetical protein FB567DRAFT_447357 [Paraphoma chrysanthemicola]